MKLFPHSLAIEEIDTIDIQSVVLSDGKYVPVYVLFMKGHKTIYVPSDIINPDLLNFITFR